MNKQISNITNILAGCYNVSIDDILCRNISMENVRPRQMGYWIARQVTDLSFIDIAKQFNRDNGQAIKNAIAGINERRKNDHRFRDASNLLAMTCLQRREFDARILDVSDLLDRPKEETRTNTGKPPPERVHIAKDRKCLTCGNVFPSEHIGNRVCPRCQETAIWRSA